MPRAAIAFAREAARHRQLLALVATSNTRRWQAWQVGESFNTALPSAKIGDTAEDGLNGNRVVSLKVVKNETARENVKACLVVSYQKRVTSDVSETATWGGDAISCHGSTPAAASA